MTVKRTRAASTKKELALQGADGTGDLPPNWLWTTLGEVAESMKNGIYKPASSYADDGLACLRMYNIDEGRIVWRDIKRMRLSESEIREYELLPGDILVNRVNSRELVGKTAAISAGLERCVFESKNIRVRLRRDVVSPEFISYRLLSAGSRYFTQNAQQVVGMASISQPQVARFPLPLPPLPEQRRIVAEIEKQFTRLEAGVAALRRVQANLKRYRAAVLKAACEGRLVPTEAELAKTGKRKSPFESGEALLARILIERRKNWQGRVKYKEPAGPDAGNLGPLPAGWTWATFEQIAERVTVGFVGSMKHEYVEEGVPFLRSQNVRENRFDPEGLLHISRQFHQKLSKSSIQPGDLAVVRSGSVGVTCVIPESLPDANCSDLVLIQRPLAFIPQYGAYYMNSLAKRHVEAGKVGVALIHFNTKSVAALAVPLPPLAEQTRIVAEVERRLSVVEELEAVVTANLQRATRLRQSILQKAFTGELV
jgi:type I restriction enzyme S subunit